MIVIDASAVLIALVGPPDQASLARAELAADSSWHAPGQIHGEVLARLRATALHHGDAARRRRAEAAALRYAGWQIDEVSGRPLLSRVWELRHTVDATDALYVAAAESLDCPVLTADARLARASGPRCAFIVI